MVTLDSEPDVALGGLRVRRLGPIAAGPIELEILLGGVAITRLRVEVLAGATTPLRIVLPPGPPR